MLRSPGAAVVGCTELEAASRFFGAVGLLATGETELAPEVARALFSVETARCRLLANAATRSGAVLLVAAPGLAPPTGLLDPGGLAVDVYTTDLSVSTAALTEWGASPEQVASYPLGPDGRLMSELLVDGPDGARLVVLETAARRPSVLDTSPELVHSEASAFVVLTADPDGELRFWSKAGGLDVLRDDVLRSPEVARMLGLPAADTPLRLTLLWSELEPSTRLELLSLPAGGPVVTAPPPPLRSGLSAVLFDVADLDATLRALPGAAVGAPVELDDEVLGPARLVAGSSPGGTRFVLRQPA
jgi:hypothetical protein